MRREDKMKYRNLEKQREETRSEKRENEETKREKYVTRRKMG